MSGVGDEPFDLESQLSNVVPSKISYVQLKPPGKRPYYMREDQAFVRPRHPKRIEFSPATTTNVTFGGSAPVVQEFKVYEQKDFEDVKFLTLRGTITKTLSPNTPSAQYGYLVEPSPLWIQRIEILVNGSSTILQTLTGDHIWLALMCMPIEDLRTLLGGNTAYMGTDFKVNNAILTTAAGATLNWDDVRTLGTITAAVDRPFVIPIMGTLLDKFRLRNLSGDTIFRVYWNQSIAVENSTARTTALERTTPANGTGSGRFSLSNVQLVLESEEVLERDKVSYERIVASQRLYVNFLEPSVQEFTQTITNNQQNPFQLTAIYGNIAFIQIYIRDIPNRPLQTPKAIGPIAATGGSENVDGQDNAVGSVINFTNSSNQPLFSPNGFTAFDLRYGHYSKHFENELPLNVPVYTLSFCENPAAAVTKGSVDGYYKFTGTEYVRITPQGSFATGSYRLYVVAWKIKTAEMDRKMAKLL